MERVVLFHGPGRPLEVVHLPTPEPADGEILVRVLCCTLCGSDLHTHAGRRAGPTPTVLGHEIVGRVAAFGPDADRVDLRGARLEVGDRITWTLAASCGECFYCADGLPQKCDYLFKYGHARWTAERPFVGGLADVVLLAPGTKTIRLPDELPDTLAALANCATATVAAVLRLGEVERARGGSILILGAGVLGLTACAMARAFGVGTVLACEKDPERRARALEFGASGVCSPDPGERDALVDEATGGRGVDLAVELAGSSATVAAGLELTRIGGVLVLAGTVLPIPAIALDPEMVVRRMLTIRGVHNYTPGDLVAAVDFLVEHGNDYPFSTLQSSSFGLERADQAFIRAHLQPGKRAAVVPASS